MTGAPDGAPARPPTKLVRVSFDETRTTSDMVCEVTSRGGKVDAVSELWGIMQVLIDDPGRLSGIPGVRSVMHHRLKEYW